MRNHSHKTLGRLTAAGLLAGLAACGGTVTPPTPLCPAGTSGTPPNCVADAPPCTQTTVRQESGPTPARTIVFDDFSVPDSGRLDVTVDWTVPASPIGFYLVPANTCTTVQEFNNRTCNFIVRSEPSSTKPRKISTPNFNAGNYRWILANFADGQESVSLQIVLSKGTCAALTGGSPEVSAEAWESLPALERLSPR